MNQTCYQQSYNCQSILTIFKVKANQIA